MKRLFFKLLDRHEDGSRHDWTIKIPLGLHSCDGLSYCHHEEFQCGGCGDTRVFGYSVEEVR